MGSQIECDESGLTPLEQLAQKLPLPGLSLDEKTNVLRESLRRQIDRKLRSERRTNHQAVYDGSESRARTG